MADPAHVQAGLRLLKRATADFDEIVSGLDAAGWATPTNLPGWDVKHLTAHLTRGAESYITAIEHGLRGDLERRMTPEDRARRMRELAALDTPELLGLFRERAQAFDALIAGLPDEQLDTQGAHSYGPRSVTWFVEQRLAELFYHGWDLRVSLGLDSELDDETARYLLPMLIESNLPTLSPGTPGWAGAIGIAVEGAPDLQWTVMMGPDAIATSRRIVSAMAELRGSAPAIALLIYGRRDLADLERQGSLKIEGNRVAVEQFCAAIGNP